MCGKLSEINSNPSRGTPGRPGAASTTHTTLSPVWDSTVPSENVTTAVPTTQYAPKGVAAGTGRPSM